MTTSNSPSRMNRIPAMMSATYIETSEFDCLHDEGILYGHKLEDAGAKLEYNDTKGTFNVSYVGNIDWGGLSGYIIELYSLTKGTP